MEQKHCQKNLIKNGIEDIAYSRYSHYIWRYKYTSYIYKEKVKFCLLVCRRLIKGGD